MGIVTDRAGPGLQAPERKASRGPERGRQSTASSRGEATIVTSRLWEEDSRWRDRAACRSSDPGLFFPVGSTGAALEQIRVAKAVCRDCPVREQCLAFALRTNQEAGIWGGTCEEERRKLRRPSRVST